MVSASDDHGVLSRRGLLRAGALIAIAVPLAACTAPQAAPTPDPLQPLLTAAESDSRTATTASTAFAANAATFAVFATVRRQQAAALRTEVDRAAALTAPPTTSASASPTTAPTDETTVIGELRAGLVTAQQQATRLVPSLPTYRAGLVGSIAAGCASLAEAFNSTPVTATSAISAGPPNVAPSGGAAATAVPTTTPGVPSSTASSPADRALSGDTVTALQQALATEHAALWLYGTASAFVTGSSETEIIAGMGAVQNLRDATERRLAGAGQTPTPAQPAYLVPAGVTNQTSALAALALAESDATVAWRFVLEHTDDPGARSVALAALIDSAVRQTRWRRLAGESPASVALPGSAA
ncbi:MAG TPA: ferritin-like domain-containing protein [Pseudonocardiaceae bacterium]